LDTYTVEFRIEGVSLIPLDVTKILEITPCHTRSIHKIKDKKQIPLWSYDGVSSEKHFVEQEWNSLEEGLTFLLDKLANKKFLISSHFSSYKTYFWCAHFKNSFNAGPTFSPELLKSLSDFGSELIIRSYHTSEE